MKVQVLQENLQRGLAVVGRAVAARSTLPITSNILMATDGGRLRLSATDLDISISTWIGAKIEEEGATTVPARLITDFVTQLPPATVSIEVPDRTRQAKLECARTESTINTMDAEDFPRIARIDEGPSIELNATTLRRTIDRVEFAAATDDSRPVITGVSIKGEEGKLTFAASDGFRLAVSDIQLEASQSFPVADLNLIVPARALREVGRLIGDGASPVELRVNEKQTQVQFSMTDVELVAQLIQGTFPNYNQLIPGEYNTVTVVDVDDFMRGARIAAIFARDGSGIVRLQVQPAADGSSGKLVISARADEVGDNEGEIDVKVEGEPSKIAFNSRYLADVLGVLEGEVRLETTSPSSQGVFRPAEEDGYVHVVMPMFVQW